MKYIVVHYSHIEGSLRRQGQGMMYILPKYVLDISLIMTPWGRDIWLSKSLFYKVEF
jgi:hypothetical protein